jgi:hypothetical protein
MKFNKVYISAAFLFFTLELSAQEQQVQSHSEGHGEFKHFRGSVVLYHTYIGTRTTEGKDLLIVPSVGLDLEYWFNHKWGIGSHNDLELISFEVEEEEGTFLERETPVLLTLDALWKPWKGLVLLAGPGIELEKEENLFVLRTGLEYELELGSHWDVAPTIFYDSRIDAYDTFSVGLGIGKRF